jgi:hypothetical protein
MSKCNVVVPDSGTWLCILERYGSQYEYVKIEFIVTLLPCLCSFCRSGTWMMTGNGVMHNGTTVIDEYGQNLDRLQVK